MCLSLLDTYHWRAFVSQSVAYAVGVAWSFVLNSRFTFGHKQLAGKTFMRFVALQLALLLLTATAFQFAVVGGLPPTESWLVIVACAVLLNFTGSRWWVFDK